nr:unnamed protein product [Digitaria exilis]
MPTPSPAPAPPCRGLLPSLSKPQPVMPITKSLASRQAQAQARARAQPVVLARSKNIDDALAAGFVRLLNASPGQGADGTAPAEGLYDPKPGDFVVGVVVSGTEARLDVAVGADNLATLLAKELLPLDRGGGDLAARVAPPRPGSVGVVAGPAVDGEAVRKHNRGSRALVAPGTVVFAEVLGRTLSGRPLLSARRLFRRLAWYRARQVGCSIRVCIVKLDEETNGLIISEKKAWIDDEVKVLVIKSNVPDKIALSIADLESAPGLFLSDREKVFSEAEEVAKRYREQLSVISQNTIDDSLPGETLPFDDDAKLYANWKWFKFLRHNRPGDDGDGDLP